MHTDPVPSDFDAIVIGGSYAGLSATLQLARARRRVLVIDAGIRRNRFAHAAHGFLSQDGRPPADIVADARAQVMAYPTVRWIAGTVTQAAKRDQGFAVSVTVSGSGSGSDSLTPGETVTAAAAATATSTAVATSTAAASDTAPATERIVHAKRLVLATGVVDDLPEMEGLAERWGRSVFHCPYCHGYELQNGRIGVLGVGPLSQHHAMMLPDWGQVTLFTNERFLPDAAQTAALTARGVAIETAPVARIVDTATIELRDGRRIVLDGLFTMSRTRIASPVAGQLGCAFDEGPSGLFIRTDTLKATTVAGVFACGDAARAAGNVAMAVGDGAQAGFATHQSLIFATDAH